MTIKYSENKKFVDLMAEDVINKLIGQHETFKRKEFPKLPSKDISIGTLYGLNDKESTQDENHFLTNSQSIKFLLDDIKDNVEITFSCSIYYRVYPTFEEQNEFIKQGNYKNKDQYKFANIWQRKDLIFESIPVKNFDEKIQIDFKKYTSEILKTEEILMKKDKLPKEKLNSKEEYYQFIQQIPKEKADINWNCQIEVCEEEFSQNGVKSKLIEINLINKTPIPEHVTYYDSSIFNPILKIQLNENELIKFKYEYEYENKSKNYDGFFRCLNCQANIENQLITTKAYGDYSEKKILPKSKIPEVDISFRTLSSDSNLVELNKILSLMNEHYNNCKINNLNMDYEGLKNFKNMKNRFEKGIKLLKTNKKANKSFQLMNTTFRLKSNTEHYDSWRLFQIVFIVSLIKDIVEEENRDICDLLHVQTGGGKSEAYFGIVIFTAFYDRIKGKKFGVSAITKFPLRMLSIQQLQRIAILFIWAEEVRLNEHIEGHPFSIAYFVGSQDDEFPRHNRKIRADIEKAKQENKTIEGKIINICPICGNEVILDIEDEKELVIHKCNSCNKIFRLYYSDDEIYRTLPTFIVATVDKFSGISTNRRFKNLFGGNIDSCDLGHGFIPHNDTCEFEEAPKKQCKNTGKYVKTTFNTGPTLIIQDEMHLIKEGFGTIDSHFETLIETLQTEFGGTPFKNIVMTATISGAKAQVKHLYHKNINIFPPTLKDNENNDFFFEQLLEDKKEVIQRRIIGLKPNSFNSKIVLFIMRYVSEFIYSVKNDLNEYSKQHDFKTNELEEILQYYTSLLTYHNKKEDVHGLNYHVDDYVNNRAKSFDYESRPLTGDNNLEYIKETMKLVKEFNNPNKLFITHATSIVSHGVDLDKWNVMIFDGMPRNTSEYIQSLSRVGRKHYGLIFLTVSTNKTRDLSFYQHFDEYHNILTDKVESVPLSRWAKLGFKQTFTSIFTASILNYLSNMLNKPIYNLQQVNEALLDSNNKKLLINFIKKSYVSDSNMNGSDITKQIEIEIEKRVDYLENYSNKKANFFPNALKDCDDKYFKTQFGMRGIQDEIALSPSSSDYNFRKSLRS